jgi:hypothetical protein
MGREGPDAGPKVVIISPEPAESRASRIGGSHTHCEHLPQLRDF